MAKSEPVLGKSNNDVGDCSQCLSVSDFPDINWFDETVIHPAISVPAQQVAHLKKQLKLFLLHDRKNVYLPQSADPENESVSLKASPQRRILIMRVGVTHEDVLVSLTNSQDDSNDENSLIWIPSFPITRGYYDMSVDEALRKLLVKEKVHEIPSSFELVGHIAHINLRDDCLPYKYWIGRVILELNQPTIRTVVNKVGTIESDNVFRTFKQEVLAGNSTEPDWSITTVYEHGCCFHLDFRHVYWNSRLSGEHHRLVQIIQASYAEKFETIDSDSNIDETKSFVVADLMAGVGPFAVPLTASATKVDKKNHKKEQCVVEIKKLPDTSKSPSKPRITVYANDLNPISYKYLTINATKNKCFNLHCSNNDARGFLQELQTKVVHIDHVIMNLPATAPEFLDSFRGWKLKELPMVHVHCFGLKSTDDTNPYRPIIERCVASLGCAIDNYNIIVVRNISPTKNMYCVSFKLPNEARYGRNKSLNESLNDNANTKRQKV